MDDALFSSIARLAIPVKDGVGEIRVEFGEGIGNEDRVVGDVAGALICYRDGPGPAADLYLAPTEDRAERTAGVDDRHGAFGMIGHIEQGAVRRKGATPRLGAYC